MTEIQETLNVETGLAESVTRVRLPSELSRRLQVVLMEESFGFSSFTHLVLSALWSFSGYKLRQLDSLRRDSEGPR